ncbi:hypothetical protein Ahy_A02g007465 [Arachis hypogaea]|uniref:LRR receptor-like serine/threonine-protein kinase n=1 Tax=Arachis hypogaea TaxID=3818 RepID=A0A445ECZ0_ARAHY|nr:hypothetical protein Ahy_A02g007465 [Arachis hypogaea]
MDLSDNLVITCLLGNKLHENILVDFGKLVGLDLLALSSNNLNGIIDIEKLSSTKFELTYLDLSINQISGSLPEHIGYAMSHLNTFLSFFETISLMVQ